MTTQEYLSLPSQERGALIEEHVFGRRVLRDWPIGEEYYTGQPDPWEHVDSHGVPRDMNQYVQMPEKRGPVCSKNPSGPWFKTYNDGESYWANLEAARDFEEPNGWWEIVLEMERKGFKYTLSDGCEGKHQCGFLKDRLISYYEHHEDRFAVQVASMRAVGFITD